MVPMSHVVVVSILLVDIDESQSLFVVEVYNESDIANDVFCINRECDIY